MNSSVISQVIKIINNKNITNDDCRNQLKICNQNRRGNNQRSINLIYELFSEYALPICNDEEPFLHLKILQNEFTNQNFILIYKKSENTYFNAVCGELLWQITHELTYANRSIHSYYELLVKTAFFSSDYMFVRMALGISRIFSKYQPLDFLFDEYFNICKEFIKFHFDDSGYCSLYILEGLISCNRNIDEVITIMTDSIDKFRKANRFDKARNYSEVLIKQFKTLNKDKVEIKSLQRGIALDFEKEAILYDWEAVRNTHSIINLIQSAMEIWSKIADVDTKSERKRLAKRIEPIKALSLKSLKSISSNSIDITEIVTNIKNCVYSLSFEEIILEISKGIRLITKEELEKDGIIRQGAISNSFAKSILDKSGRKKCIIPSSINATQEEKDAIFIHEATEKYLMDVEITIQRFLWFAKDKHIFSNETLLFLVEKNGFIPGDRQKSFLNGLVSGFNLDLTTSMHILMPQIENAIRELANLCGAITYKTNSDGTEECLSMESVLSQPEVEECFEDSFLFNLKVFYTSKYGIGMRNIIAHGLNSDESLQTSQSLAVWWFTLYLCCCYSLGLRERLYNLHNKLEKASNIQQDKVNS